MKDYTVSYYLGDFYHAYTVEAETEVDAILQALNRIPDTSKPLFHDFKIKRAVDRW